MIPPPYEKTKWPRYEVFRADNGYWYVYGVGSEDVGLVHWCLTDTEIAHETAEAAWSEIFEEGAVWELRLCETEMLFLHPDRLYRFTVDPNCKRCCELRDITSR